MEQDGNEDKVEQLEKGTKQFLGHPDPRKLEN
jgi:hypothetical protein